MQFHSFELIINLLGLNLGVSFVPIRALALYNRKQTLTRVRLPEGEIGQEFVCPVPHEFLPNRSRVHRNYALNSRSRSKRFAVTKAIAEGIGKVERDFESGGLERAQAERRLEFSL
jgi:hypothetical protein